jgi:hypothetical protein
VRQLILAHGDEFNRHYKKAREAFEPAEEGILRRLTRRRAT